MDWNEHYLQQDEAEKKETIRVNQEKATAERTALAQRYNHCIDQLQELVPKLFKFYEENPPREHFWLEIEGKKIASWLLIRNSRLDQARIFGEFSYVDLFDLYLLVDGRFALYRSAYTDDGERIAKHEEAKFYSTISLKHDGALAFVGFLESACKRINEILKAPEKERQDKIAAEEEAKRKANEAQKKAQREAEKDEQRLKQGLQRGEIERKAFLEQQKKAAEQKQVSFSPVIRFGKSFKNTIQNIYEISVEALYILFGAIINVVLAFIALFFLGRDQPLIAIVVCAIALYVFIRICTKKFKHKKVDTLISQCWTKKSSKPYSKKSSI